MPAPLTNKSATASREWWRRFTYKCYTNTSERRNITTLESRMRNNRWQHEVFKLTLKERTHYRSFTPCHGAPFSAQEIKMLRRMQANQNTQDCQTSSARWFSPACRLVPSCHTRLQHWRWSLSVKHCEPEFGAFQRSMCRRGRGWWSPLCLSLRSSSFSLDRCCQNSPFRCAFMADFWRTCGVCGCREEFGPAQLSITLPSRLAGSSRHFRPSGP